VQERAKAWDDLNKKTLAKKARQEALEKENWVDEQEDQDGMDDDFGLGDAEGAVTEAFAELIPLPESTAEEEEVL
jgi:TATA-binding protein-associated factor Taf7